MVFKNYGLKTSDLLSEISKKMREDKCYTAAIYGSRSYSEWELKKYGIAAGRLKSIRNLPRETDETDLAAMAGTKDVYLVYAEEAKIA